MGPFFFTINQFSFNNRLIVFTHERAYECDTDPFPESEPSVRVIPGAEKSQRIEYRIAAAESPSMEPKLPWPCTSG